MKTEDLLAYDRERKNVSRAFAQAEIELILPLAEGRPQPAATRAKAGAPSRESKTPASSGSDPHMGE